MLPVSDVIPTRTSAWLTRTLVAAIASIGVGAAWLAPEAAAGLYDRFGLRWSTFVPGALTAPLLHEGWLHTIATCLAFWVLGPAPEDRLGRVRLGVTLVGLALVSAVADAQTARSAFALPVIGAGGVVAGLSGLYLRLFPRSRVVLVVPLPRLDAIEVPAWLFAAVWFVVDALAAVGRSTAEPATAALTLAGYLVPAAAGALIAPLVVRADRMRPEWWDQPNGRG